MTRRQWWLVSGVLAVVVLALASVTHSLGLDGLDSLSGVIGSAAGVASLIVAYLAWTRPRTPEASSPTQNREESLDALAVTIEAVWRPEQHRRRLLNPHPLPTGWITIGPLIADGWANVRADGVDEPLDLDGCLDLEHPDALHQVVTDVRLRGRVVILGEPGAGKTALLLRQALRILAQRKRGERVPVLLRLSTWNPDEQTLDQWITDRLSADYGHRRPRPIGHLLPLLDGLDEMPPPRRGRALRAIGNTFDPDAPLILTSRTNEYLDALTALAGNALAAAAVLELTPLPPGIVREHLRKATARPGDWEAVFTRDSAHNGGRLAAALTQPLWVDLARTSYTDPDRPDNDPHELLGPPDRDAIHGQLLDRLIPAAYPDPPEPGPDGRTWRPDRAERYLRHLAADMRRRDTQDLAWWELIRAVPRPVRAALGPSFGLGFWLLSGLLGRLKEPPSPSRRQVRWRRAAEQPHGRQLGRGLVAGLEFGLTLGLTSGVAGGIFGGFAVGLRFGLTYGVASGLALGLTLGLAIGLAGGLAYGLAREFTTLFDAGDADVPTATDPTALLRNDRRRMATTTLGLGLASGLVAAIPGSLLDGLLVGLAFGLPAGLGVSAWGPFGLARLWWCGHGRLPWPVMAFLADAHRRGVLRQAGGVYQFRHALLRDRLALAGHDISEPDPVSAAGERRAAPPPPGRRPAN